MTLHGERDGAASLRRVRRTVRARVTHAIDLDRELHVLAGTKAPPVAVGTQDEARHVAGLGADRLDPRQDPVQAELRAQLARIEVEHVLVEERAHDRRGEQAGERCGHTGERRDARWRAVLRVRGHSIEAGRGCSAQGRIQGIAEADAPGASGTAADPGGVSGRSTRARSLLARGTPRAPRTKANKGWA